MINIRCSFIYIVKPIDLYTKMYILNSLTYYF